MIYLLNNKKNASTINIFLFTNTMEKKIKTQIIEDRKSEFSTFKKFFLNKNKITKRPDDNY